MALASIFVFRPVLAAASALLVLGESDRTVPAIFAARATTPPHLDGRLDDTVWGDAPSSDAFTQKYPDEGAPPTERTSVRVLYDDHSLYVGVRCEQVKTPILRRLTRRDREVEADRITVDVGSRGDGMTAYHFGVNAEGVLSDGIHFNDTEFTSNWDENWEGVTSSDDRGWSAELRIPLRILRFEALPIQAWGFNVRRFITLRQEIAEWSFVPRAEAGVVSRLGRLQNLSGLTPRHGIEVRPFVVGKVTHLDPGLGPRTGYGAGYSAGLDAKWHVGQDMTLDMTFNPDFGQVEADQVVLNLTTTEQFFPEKRPFFLEGIETFATPKEVLYTRRIGRPPDGLALLPQEIFADLPAPSIIYGAAKLVGRPTRLLTVGAISAMTGRNAVPVREASGVVVDRTAVPMSSYQVLRLRLDATDNGHIGLVATAVNRFERSGDYPALGAPGAPDERRLCPGGAEVSPGGRCFHDAYVAALDGRARSRSGDYVIRGMALGSLTSNGPARTFRDGTVIRAGDADVELNFSAAKDGGRRWLWSVGSNMTGRRFDRNELGFMRRQNDWWVNGDVSYRVLDPGPTVLETRSWLEVRQGVNLDGLLLARSTHASTFVKLAGFWTFFAGVGYAAPRFDDREVGDGTALERAGAWRLDVEAGTDPRRRVVVGLEGNAQRLTNGAAFNAGAALTVRTLPQLDLELLGEASTTYGEPRFAGRDGTTGEPRFGDLRAATVGATLRATYTFTPRLTLQTYAQVFLSSVRYSDFTSPPPTGPGSTVRLADLSPAAAPTTNPDFQSGVLNVSVVLRWEYRLGSTAFLVYTRSQAPTTDLPPGGEPRLDLGAVPRGPAADAVLLKLSYWWG